MDARPIYKILSNVRNRLNFILILTHIFKIMKLTAIIAGIIIILGHWYGWWAAYFWGWGLFIIGGAMAGLLRGWRHRLSLTEAAGWVDRELQDYEAFSAALVCLDRGCEGIFDRSMIQRASIIADGNLVLHWPFKSILRQICQLSAILLFMIIAMIFGFRVNPVSGTGMVQVRNSSQIEPISTNPTRNIGNRAVPHITGDIKARDGARTLAQSLFPQDLNLAKLAEKALIRGDLESIKNLMKQSSMSFEDQVTSPGQKRRMTEKYAEAMRTLSHYGFNKPGNEPQTENKDSALSDVKKAGKNNKSPSNVQKEGTPDPSRWGPPNISGDDIQARMKGEMAQHLFQKGSPGNGFDNMGTLNGNRTKQKSMLKLTPGKSPSNTRKVMITKNEDRPVLEFVVPGKNSTIPVTQMLPNVKRQAEAAMERKGIPGEYQDFMRFYFSELSQKLKTDKAP